MPFNWSHFPGSSLYYNRTGSINFRWNIKANCWRRPNTQSPSSLLSPKLQDECFSRFLHQKWHRCYQDNHFNSIRPVSSADSTWHTVCFFWNSSDAFWMGQHWRCKWGNQNVYQNKQEFFSSQFGTEPISCKSWNWLPFRTFGVPYSFEEPSEKVW